MTIDPDDYDLRERRRTVDEPRDKRADERENDRTDERRTDETGDRHATDGRQNDGEQRARRGHKNQQSERPRRNHHRTHDREAHDVRRAPEHQDRERNDRERDASGSDRDAGRRNGYRRRNGRQVNASNDAESAQRRNGRTDPSRGVPRSREDAPDGEVSVRPGNRNDVRRSGREDDVRRSHQSDDVRRSHQSDDVRRSHQSDDVRRSHQGDDVSRPRRGDSDHARAHDEVVEADRIARHLGFDEGDSPREGDSRRGRESRNDAASERTRQPRAASSREQPDHSELDRARLDRLDSTRESGRTAPRDRGRNAEFESPEDVGRFQFDTEIRERPRGRAGELLRESQLEELLIQETAAANDGLAKPYLSSLPDAYVAERLVFDWLEFLVLNGGYKRTMDALRYYHTVEWLTADVEAELQDYLVGFSGEVSSTREYDVDDHHLSLVYIARLASMSP